MELSEMYHVGIVVSDLAAAMTHFTELLGVEWGPVVESMVEVRDGEGHDLVLPSRICYSTRAPYLELIQEVPGSPWVCNEHSNLHHIGFYAGDLAAESNRLSTAACPLELRDGHGAARPELFTYHRDPLGVRIEFVNAALREGMEAYLCRPPAS